VSRRRPGPLALPMLVVAGLAAAGAAYAIGRLASPVSDRMASAAASARPGDSGATTAAPASSAGDSAHEQGRRIYNFRCYYCHGYSGDAKTLAATYMTRRPRDFQALAPEALPRDAMLQVVSQGVPGTAMAGFHATLTEDEIARVVDFVREEFMRRKARNTAYHTEANGWPRHERYRAAYPFATGEIPLDRDWDLLDETQAAGKRLYLSACVSCHDRGHVTREGDPWELRGVSFPPGNYEEGEEHHAHGTQPSGHQPTQAEAAIDPYELHEDPPKLIRPSARVRLGERVFQSSCAYCHAADGTGRNWIGSFLEPHPADFTDAQVRLRLDSARVAQITRDGIPNSSMPAWRSVLQPREIEAVAAYVQAAFGPGANVDDRSDTRTTSTASR
jgi:cytochrome c oxidase cbb3-type subunit 3